MVKQNWIHEIANSPMPAGGGFCRLMCLLGRLLAQLHTHCQKSSFLFPHSMVACAIRCPCWQCSWLSQGSCTGAWLPTALSLTFFCLALRAASPYIPFPPVIQSFSSCSKRFLTQKRQPLLGPGSGMGPLLLLLLCVLLLFLLFLCHLAFCILPNLFLLGQREDL